MANNWLHHWNPAGFNTECFSKEAKANKPMYCMCDCTPPYKMKHSSTIQAL